MKKRDYRAEYARRIARAKEKGYSKSVARGHAPKGTISLARAKKLKLPPGFVLIRKTPRKGFKATKKSRADHLRELGLQPTREVLTSEEEFINMLTQSGFDEREAYTLWFS